MQPPFLEPPAFFTTIEEILSLVPEDHPDEVPVIVDDEDRNLQMALMADAANVDPSLRPGTSRQHSYPPEDDTPGTPLSAYQRRRQQVQAARERVRINHPDADTTVVPMDICLGDSSPSDVEMNQEMDQEMDLMDLFQPPPTPPTLDPLPTQRDVLAQEHVVPLPQSPVQENGNDVIQEHRWKYNCNCHCTH